MITFKNSVPWINQYPFNSSQSSGFFSWSAGTALPAARSSFGVLSTKNRVYLFGGFTGASSPVSSILTATVDGSGVLGSFSTDTNSLPVALANLCVAVVLNKVYLIGGVVDNADTYTNAIYSANISADGTIGAFTSVGTYARATKAANSFIYNSRLYIVDHTAISSIPLNSDATLNFSAGWRSDGTLDVDRIGGVIWWLGSRLYIAGGENSGTNCRYATVDGGGAFGSWTNAGLVNGAIAYAASVTATNMQYVFGGSNEGTSQNVLKYSAITAGATSATWTTGTVLSVARDSFGAIVTSSRIYLIGGRTDGTDISTVSYATFSGGLNDYTNEFGTATNDGVIVPPKETVTAYGICGNFGSITLTSPLESIVGAGVITDVNIVTMDAEFDPWVMDAVTGSAVNADFENFDGYLEGKLTIHADFQGEFELFQCDSNSGAALEDSFELMTADGVARIDIRAVIEGQFELFDMTGELSWSINAQLDASFKLFTCDGEASKKDTNDISADFELFTCSGEISKVKNCTIEASFVPFNSTGYISTSIIYELDAYFEEFTCFGEINKTSVFESIKFSR